MRRYGKRLAILAALIATLVVIAVVGWWLWPEDLFFPRLEPAAPAPAASFTVGENVHVSKVHETIAFTECIIAADPNRTNRLFASSLYWPHPGGTSVVGYLSDDGGATWSTSLESVSDRAKKARLVDQTAVFGPDGDLYFVHARMNDAQAGPGSLGTEGAGSLEWLCLPDGATAWETRGRIDRKIDRPWLAVDHTTGRNRGRLYCTGNIGAPYLIISLDGGRTFQFPKAPECPRGTVYPAQPVVLSDGSLLAAFRWTRPGGFRW
jgi:hypothetical protein